MGIELLSLNLESSFFFMFLVFLKCAVILGWLFAFKNEAEQLLGRNSVNVGRLCQLETFAL